ncbi:hypothetical protein BC834DRAFT_882476 [Gloeopeniophorella convolvens]|nr:hypothetical protein BC834DRAFT_882476 [Gloeopeniophorella convolvens]
MSASWVRLSRSLLKLDFSFFLPRFLLLSLIISLRFPNIFQGPAIASPDHTSPDHHCGFSCGTSRLRATTVLQSPLLELS